MTRISNSANEALQNYSKDPTYLQKKYLEFKGFT